MTPINEILPGIVTSMGLRQHVSSMLEKRLIEHHATVDKDTHDLLLFLINRHPEAKNKLGAGIKRFILMRNHGGYPHVEFIRIDNSRDSFSWRKCTMKVPKTSVRSRSRQALREAISEQVCAEKTKAELICALCGKGSKNRNDFDLDHYPVSFETLVQNFKTHSGLTSLQISHSLMGAVLTDPIQRNLWQNFHAEYAKYRLLCRPCHKST